MATKKEKKTMKTDEESPVKEEAPVEEKKTTKKASGPSAKAIALVADVFPLVTGREPTEADLQQWAAMVDEHGLNRPALEVRIKATRRAL